MTTPTPTRRRRRGDRGAATTETVIMVPVGFLLLLTVVQFGVWAHATHIAHAAADTGLAHARSHEGNAAGAHHHAAGLLDDLGGASLLNQPTITVERTSIEATIVVEGVAASVVPGLQLPVQVEVSGPVERFTTNSGEFANSEASSGSN